MPTPLTPPHAVGRLVALLDATPHPLSLKAFARAAREWIGPANHLSMPTLLASTNKDTHATFATRWPRLFYNVAEPATFGQLLGFLPWAEIWLVQQGQVWALTEGHLLALADDSLGNLGDNPLPAGFTGLEAEDHNRHRPG